MVTQAQRKVDVQEKPATSLALHTILLPLVLLFAMVCATLFIYAVLPLRGLFFYLAFPNTQFGSRLLEPTHLLFPGKAISLPKHYPYLIPASRALAWQETGLLFAGFAVFFALYLLAIRLLPQRITQRYIMLSTTLLGLLLVLFPAMTSQDIFSYIAYARIGVLYHLNPLTTLPTAIPKDSIYPYLSWIHQPSAYGPTWILITCMMQWAALIIGLKSILSMTLLLRLFGLALHLASIQLVWLLSGSLSRLTENSSQRTRLLATLAFAWNPLLLFEACVNAHNDTSMLFFLLLALWFLLPRGKNRPQPYMIAVVLLAIATCIKVTIVVLVPLVLLFLWKRRSQGLQHSFIALTVYLAVILLLYAPFWQHGAALDVFHVNPGTTRNINSPYEFLLRFYESSRHRMFVFVTPDRGNTSEILMHKISYVLFSVLYAVYLLYALCTLKELMSLPLLIRSMAFAWLFYCFIGSPWLWPWYLVTFFGLFALIEAVETSWRPISLVLRLPLAARLLAFGFLSLYCFDTWGPIATMVPHLYSFQMTYLRGLWICVVPLLAIRFPLPVRLTQRARQQANALSLSGKRSVSSLLD